VDSTSVFINPVDKILYPSLRNVTKIAFIIFYVTKLCHCRLVTSCLAMVQICCTFLLFTPPNDGREKWTVRRPLARTAGSIFTCCIIYLFVETETHDHQLIPLHKALLVYQVQRHENVCGCMTPRNHTLGNRWRWEVAWTSWPLYYRERAHAGWGQKQMRSTSIPPGFPASPWHGNLKENKQVCKWCTTRHGAETTSRLFYFRNVTGFPRCL